MLSARFARPRFHRWSTVGWVLFLLFMELVAIRSLQDRPVTADFRSFYAAGYMVRTHPSTLYHVAEQARVQDQLISRAEIALPYFHPAYEALLYAPLSFAPYLLAYRLSILCNVLLLAGVVLLLPELRSSGMALLRRNPGILLFVFAPVLVALFQGQDSILFLLLASGAWRLLRARRDFWAGFVLGLALFRYQLAVPLAGILALRRGLGFLAGFATSAVLVGGLSVLLTGPAATGEMLHLLNDGSLLREGGTAMQQFMAIHPLAMPNLFGLVYACGASLMRPALAAAVVLAASAAVYLWTAYRARLLRREREVFASAVLVSILVSYHLYPHDLSLLILPFSLLRTPPARLLAAVVYGLSVLLYALGDPNRLFLLAIPVLCLWGLAVVSPVRFAAHLRPWRHPTVA